MPPVQPVDLNLDPYPLDHASLPRVLKKAGSTQIALIRHLPQYPAGMCYWNVMQQIATHGGKARLGWLAHWLPGLYIGLCHHAIWETPEGDLIDITAVQDSRSTSTSTVILVEDEMPDLSLPVTIEDRHVLLTDDPLVDSALRAYRRNNRATAERYALIRKQGGYHWDIRTGALSVMQFTPEVAEQWRRISYEMDRSFDDLHLARGEILRKYFPQGR